MAVYTTIDNPELYFQTKLYTGTGTSTAFTLDGDEDMQPDLVWIKRRDSSDDHEIFDAVRGANETLNSNTTNAEATVTGSLTSFNSDGFTLGGDFGNVNGSSNTQVAWCWKESATAGFDIVSYTGNGSVRDLSHSLSAVPEFIIVKNREGTGGWVTYHHKMASDPETDYLMLNNNAAVADYADYWNDTAPTSSVITLGTDSNTPNGSGNDMIMYAFASKQGFSKIGSYIGNGNADGATVWCGFSPAFVLIKSTASGVWRMWDNKRPTAGNPNNKNFQANSNGAEYDDASIYLDFLSNGFKARSTDSSYNGSGTSYVYMAFAEAPFVNSNGVPCNAR
jgi:hypothetical protein